jgi:glycosyltransferase involved in cell wall biosynthesis
VHVAVVVPAFNVAPYLRVAIQSVLQQAHGNWVMIVVDDGSTDSTANVAAGFADSRIRLIRQANAGVSAARNAGIDASLASTNPRPEAFLFLDADDWLAPNALGLLACALRHAPLASAACGRYARVGADEVAHISPPPTGGSVLERLMIRNLFANGGHLLIRRAAIESAGAFRRDLSYGEDWEYWTRLALLGEITVLADRSPVLFVRERQGSAYQSRATDPAAYRTVLETIYRNPALANRFRPAKLHGLRRKAEAEIAWAVGRELVRHGHGSDGWRWLARSIRESPSLKRLGLLGLACLRTGPFRRYELAT